MKVGVPRETAADERRVALVPETVKRLTGGGFDVAVERGAGEAASFVDAAYAEAGADCLYAPGLASIDEVTAVVRAVAPKPVNVLARSTFAVRELANVGVRRISVGGAFARAAWTGFLDAVREAEDCEQRLLRTQHS